MPQSKTPLITRIPIASRAKLRNLAANPKYGNLSIMYEHLFAQFLKERPYRSRNFAWQNPAKTSTPGWITYNIILPDDFSQRLKTEAFKLEINLMTVLYSALLWWIDRNPDA